MTCEAFDGLAVLLNLIYMPCGLCRRVHLLYSFTTRTTDIPSEDRNDSRAIGSNLLHGIAGHDTKDTRACVGLD